MDARRLNRLVTIKSPPTDEDEVGHPTGDWTTVGTFWANVRFLNGVESIKGGAQTGTAKASIRLRNRTGLTTAMRAELGSTVLQITAVLPDEQDKVYMDLSCEVIA